MPKQISRLLIAFAVFITCFLIVRQMLIPESFGKYGHYRANSIQEIQAKEPKFAGAGTCTSCHDSIVNLTASGEHKVLPCETCHGPSYQHNQKPEKFKLESPDERKFCEKCHVQNMAKGKNIIQIDIKDHYNDKNEKCIKCHNAHEPWM